MVSSPIGDSLKASVLFAETVAFSSSIQNILILEFWCELNFVNPPQNAAFSSSGIRSTCVM